MTSFSVFLTVVRSTLHATAHGMRINKKPRVMLFLSGICRHCRPSRYTSRNDYIPRHLGGLTEQGSPSPSESLRISSLLSPRKFGDLSALMQCIIRRSTAATVAKATCTANTDVFCRLLLLLLANALSRCSDASKCLEVPSSGTVSLSRGALGLEPRAVSAAASSKAKAEESQKRRHISTGTACVCEPMRKYCSPFKKGSK